MISLYKAFFRGYAMSLNIEGFDAWLEGSTISLAIANNHPLIKLSNALPWDTLLTLILPDLK